MPYPGELERIACAARTSAEVAELSASPWALTFQEQLTVKWLSARCEICRACPATRAALALLAPPAEPAPPSGGNVIPFRRVG